MRKWTWALTALLLGGAARGQQSPPPAALDGHLNQWEQKMKAVDSLVGPCARTEKDKAFGSVKVFEGTARFLKPNMAILETHRKDKPEIFEKFVCTGTYLYEYSQLNKVIRVHELPQKNGKADDNFLSFLFGMRAADAKQRYQLKLSKEDAYYIYVDIVPKQPADKADFSRAQLVLTKGSYLPRRLWFEQPNGNEVTWDLPKTEQNRPLDRKMFLAPETPAGWTLERVPRATPAAPANPPPRVYRPNN